MEQNTQNKSIIVTKNSTRRKVWIGISVVLVVLLLFGFIFGVLPFLLSSGDNNSSKDKTFEITSVEVLFENKVVDSVDFEYGDSQKQFEVRINKGQDLSDFDVPKIEWSIEGDSYGSSITNNGLYTVGNVLNSPTNIVVNVSSKNKMSASVTTEVTLKNNSVLQSIRVANSPNTISFVEGQSFDTTGLEVEATFLHSSGEYSVIVPNYTINAPSTLNIQDTNIEISYTHDDVTRVANLPIVVGAKSLQDIEIESVQVDYVEGQIFDTTNLVVIAHYEYLQIEISELVEIEVDEILTLQSKLAKVIFADGVISKTATINLNVTKRVLQNIELDYSQVRTEYTQGDIFDRSNLVAIANYEHTTRTLDSNEYTIANERLLTSDVEIMVSYTEDNEMQTGFIPIIVHEPYSEYRQIKFVVGDNADEIDVGLSWRYEYIANDGEQVEIDNVNNDYNVPFGANVELTIHNPSIMQVVVDGVEYRLSQDNRAIKFIAVSDKDIVVEFDEIAGNRTTVRLVDTTNNIRYVTNLISNTTRLSDRDINNIQQRFFESSPNWDNEYYVNGIPYKIEQVKEMEFFSSITIEVIRNYI
ncbi:MAG: hypothetical protein LBK70_03665 [Clostridiales bacterium]|jgi:hypothetical protein|nr:hypothetical protein [Clostridiales bacterium]